MTVGILGLGLIGGSLAKAYKAAGHFVYAHNRNESILSFSMLSGVVDSPLNRQSIGRCELILLSIYADASATWLEDNAQYINKNTLVIDCCGIKTDICRRCFALAEKYGFTFIGGHPMAGLHLSGYKYSRADMFSGAPMVLVPPRFDDPELIARAKAALKPCGFGMFSFTTAQEHDKVIGFTSQMPHILSNAFIKSPTALRHKGFSAGSYKDLTRVAWLNPQMWSELFLSNADNLLEELDFYIASLSEYRKAIAQKDEARLIQLLDEGRKRKEEVDG